MEKGQGAGRGFLSERTACLKKKRRRREVGGRQQTLLGLQFQDHNVLNLLVSEDGKHMLCFRITRPNFLGKPSGSRRVNRWDSDEEKILPQLGHSLPPSASVGKLCHGYPVASKPHLWTSGCSLDCEGFPFLLSKVNMFHDARSGHL